MSVPNNSFWRGGAWLVGWYVCGGWLLAYLFLKLPAADASFLLAADNANVRGNLPSFSFINCKKSYSEITLQHCTVTQRWAFPTSISHC